MRRSTLVLWLAACGGGTTTATSVADGPLAMTVDAPIVMAADAPVPDAPPAVTGADPRSVYLQMASDVTVANTPQTLLNTSIDLAAEEWVLVTSDGRFFPNGTAAMAEMRIIIDGITVSNRSIIDWLDSLDPVQHSFNAVGAKRLEAGSHTVALVATPTRAGFTVGAGSNLSVMIRPAARVTATSLAGATQAFDFNTLNIQEGDPATHQSLLTDSFFVPDDVATAGPLVALASAGSIRAGHDGDAMLGIYLDGVDPGNGEKLWTVNDTCQCAEEHAPLFTHAYLKNLTSGAHAVTLGALELPWAQNPPVDDPAIFEVGDDATLLTLSGNLTVTGSYATDDVVNQRLDYFPIATSEGWPNTPPVGTDVKIAEAGFEVPAGHTGVVIFMTKTRRARRRVRPRWRRTLVARARRQAGRLPWGPAARYAVLGKSADPLRQLPRRRRPGARARTAHDPGVRARRRRFHSPRRAARPSANLVRLTVAAATTSTCRRFPTRPVVARAR
jgi:hypothetical protein